MKFMNGCKVIVQQGSMSGVLEDYPDRPALILGSPPYALKGNRYEGGGNMKPDGWVEFMRASASAAIKICSGFVVWVVNGPVRGGKYHPVVERLIVEMSNDGFACERPLIWHKNAPPNRRDWFSNDWEYVVAFRRAGPRPYFNPKGLGIAPKYKSGGHFRQRCSNGQRRKGGEYPTNKIANARDVIRSLVGGGHMGSKLAHDNEAPYPESLIEPIIKCCTRPGDIVLDPFCGSGTTLAVALRLGRNAIGIDSRKSQVELTLKRLKEVGERTGADANEGERIRFERIGLEQSGRDKRGLEASGKDQIGLPRPSRRGSVFIHQGDRDV